MKQVNQCVIVLNYHFWIERSQQLPGALRFKIMLTFDNKKLVLPDRFL